MATEKKKKTSPLVPILSGCLSGNLRNCKAHCSYATYNLYLTHLIVVFIHLIDRSFDDTMYVHLINN